MPQKMHERTSSEKMLILYSLLLSSSRQWSLTEIAEHLQCAKSTALRLLAKIESFEGLRLVSRTRGTAAGRPEKCYELEKTLSDGEKSHTVVSAEEMRLLHLCRDIALPLLPPALQKTLAAVLRRTSVLVPTKDVWKEPQWPQLRMAMLGTIDYGRFQDILQGLLLAMTKKQVCQIGYKAQDKPSRSYEMAVTGLCGSRQALYAKGWLVRDKGAVEPLHPLFLAVHRMENVVPTRRTHQLPAINEDGQYFGLIEEKPFSVKIFFESELETYIRERRFSSEQRIEKVEGGIELTFTAHSDMEVAAWLLGFGSKARAIEPAWLVRHMRAELAVMNGLYSD
ncbi:MAG: WYL domain-containing protein [Desulfovibrio sp.]|uniref:WYL domain-containing protein n=1 Tax=Desulfovibrio sp. TaxID=885 RepID=UPI002A35C81D|nr:WYL domain-containing protein [Desulfovibrio sp.]MDY0260236.1 WYL domain-containing protein [Desulfovibrio sp.]